MPISHTVLIKEKAGTSKEQTEDMYKQVRTLRSIKGVLWIECGRNFTNRADYEHVLAMAIESKEALEYYQKHPDHVKVRDEYIRPVAEHLHAVDFEY